MEEQERCKGASKEAGESLHLQYLMEKIRKPTVALCKDIWKVGREDPRRIIHALKVGVALTSVSFLYLLDPLYEGIGQNAMWAVMTVVVVLEFTAGATICKGLNRGLGTLFAASLAFLIEIIAEKSSTAFRASFIGTSVFLIGFLLTYLRFFPPIKKNYDYGVVIFLLTFNLITVSSFRVKNVLHLARDRLCMIGIGCGFCLFMTLVVLPNWSGEELHNSTISKLEALGSLIQDCVDEYFRTQDNQNKDAEDKSFKDHTCRGYVTILDSKTRDETLAVFASWEPRRCHKFPWKQYVKLGCVLRHFGYTAVALQGCLESEIQTPQSVRALFQDPCTRVAAEVSKVLTELSWSIRNHHKCSPNALSDHLHEALKDLNSAIKAQPRLFLGSKHSHTPMHMYADGKSDKDMNPLAALPSARSDISSIQERHNKKVANQSRESAERKILRRTLSKIAITSLEFSEALPFAAFASLLVEMVARLELVIEEVEELGRAAMFKEESQKDGITIHIQKDNNRHGESFGDFPISVVPPAFFLSTTAGFVEKIKSIKLSVQIGRIHQEFRKSGTLVCMIMTQGTYQSTWNIWPRNLLIVS